MMSFADYAQLFKTLCLAVNLRSPNSSPVITITGRSSSSPQTEQGLPNARLTTLN